MTGQPESARPRAAARQGKSIGERDGIVKRAERLGCGPFPRRRRLRRLSSVRRIGGRGSRRRGAGPPGRCRGRCRAIGATRPARRARPSACALCNSACGGIRSSWSPCTSSTGGRDLISAATACGVTSSGHDQHAGIADDRGGRDRATQPDVQRHHRALAEADERERRRRQLAAGEFGVEELLEHGRRLVGADPAFVRIAEGQLEPFPADRRLRRTAPAHAARRTRHRAVAAARRGRCRSGRCRRRHSRAGTRPAAAPVRCAARAAGHRAHRPSRPPLLCEISYCATCRGSSRPGSAGTGAPSRRLTTR